jgi:hypothetical protein
MTSNFQIILTCIIFLIIGIVTIVLPYRVKLWAIKGDEKNLNSIDNKIYFIGLRIFGILSISISLYVVKSLLMK